MQIIIQLKKFSNKNSKVLKLNSKLQILQNFLNFKAGKCSISKRPTHNFFHSKIK